jgi:hypothetical protein
MFSVGRYCETHLGISSAISVTFVFTFWHINLQFVFKFNVCNLFNSYLYSVYVIVTDGRWVLILVLKSNVSQTQQFIAWYISGDWFRLISHHQAILNHSSIGTLSSSAHFWDPRMFTINNLGSQKFALLLNVPILLWFRMAWWWFCKSKLVATLIHQAVNCCVLTDLTVEYSSETHRDGSS